MNIFKSSLIIVHVPTYILLSLIRHIKMGFFLFSSKSLSRAKNSQPAASLLKYPINNNKHRVRRHSIRLLYPRSGHLKLIPTNSSAVFSNGVSHVQTPMTVPHHNFRRCKTAEKRRMLPVHCCTRDAIQTRTPHAGPH